MGKGKVGEKEKQVTRGHNIVADGWANPYPHPTPLPTPPPTQTHTQQVAQGQYVVVPVALLCMIVNLSEGKQGSRPQRGQSPVEHRVTFVRPFVCLGQVRV